MKKYKVSLAVKVPSNFEMEVSADNKKEALEKALEKYENRNFDSDNMKDPLWSEAELDINEESEIDSVGNGIFIEEI